MCSQADWRLSPEDVVNPGVQGQPGQSRNTEKRKEEKKRRGGGGRRNTWWFGETANQVQTKQDLGQGPGRMVHSCNPGT